jgi:hypothetical protein
VRWPWQRERSEAGPRTSVSEPASPPAVQPLPVPPAGWAFLPPLQRTIGPMELAHGPERFAGSLAAWTNPSFTRAMSHLVTADAPPGVIDVDGGTASGETYSSVPPETTLLVPPARSRPGGGLTTAVQRTTAATETPAGAAPAGAAALARALEVSDAEPRPALPAEADAGPAPEPGIDDGGKLAGEPPVPVQPAAAVQRAAAPTQVSPSHDIQIRGGDTKGPALPLAAMETANPGAEPASEDRIADWDITPGTPTAGWDIVPPLRPTSADSASDGSATYVLLPVPPAVQRAAEDRPTERTSVPAPLPPVYPSRLGLGRPLSFSQPESSDMPAPPARFGQDAVVPVQRTLGPAEAAPVQRRLDPGKSAADSGGGTSAEATATPGPSHSEAGKRPESLPSESGVEGSGDGAAPVSGAATEVDTVAASPDRAGEEIPRPSEAVGSEATGMLQQSRPASAEESSAQLISDALPLPSLSPSGEPGLEALPLQRSHGDGAADLPVVTRPASHEQAQHNSQDGGPLTGDSETVGASKKEVVAAILQPDEPPGDTPDGLGPVAGPMETGSLSSSASGEEAPALSRRLLGETGSSGETIASGMPFGNGIPIQRFEHGQAESAELPAGTGLPGQVAPYSSPRPPARASEPPGARGTPPPAVPSAGTVQRADQTTGTASARSTLRASRPMASGLRAAVWQRLTAIPAAVQQPAASTVPLATPALTVPGHPAGRREDATDGPDAGSGMADGPVSEPEPMPVASHRAPDTGYQRDVIPADFGHTEVPPLGDLGEKPGPSAAVGSVVQQEQPLAVQPLQRTVNLAGAIPARASHPPSQLRPRGTTGDGVVDSRTQDPVVLTLAAPMAAPMTGEWASHGLTGSVQRLSLPEEPEAAAPAATGPGTAPAVHSAPSSPVEASGQAPAGGTELPEVSALPEGTAPRAKEPSTVAAPGPLGAATPDQLEELAKRLAGPIIRRIKAEMLLDRERRGLRTDPN